MTAGLQVVLDCPDAARRVAGLPAAVRAAQLLRGDLVAERVVFLTESAGALRPWSGRFESLSWTAAVRGRAPAWTQLLRESGPVLALGAHALPQDSGLREFLAAARASQETLLLRSPQGEVLAAWHPDAARLRAASAGEPAREALFPARAAACAAAGGWRCVRDAQEARAAEDALFDELPQEADGYIARLDRRLSMALSRRFLRLPVTPNHITAMSLVIGILGAALLTAAAYSLQVLGAVLLWSCCILDGCDGEVARLKLLCSPAGARFDVLADNIVHAAIFIALPLHLRRMHPGAQVLLPGGLLLSGFLLSAFWVWRLVLVRPKEERAGLELFIERMASRDFIYLILLLTVFRHLDWFLWGAAFGSHAFWLFLAATAFKERRLSVLERQRRCPSETA